MKIGTERRDPALPPFQSWTESFLPDKLALKVLPKFSAKPRKFPDVMASPLSFMGFAWKNLGRRRLRTLLTLGGITMGIAAFVALVGFSRAFEHEWLRMYESSGDRYRCCSDEFPK